MARSEKQKLKLLAIIDILENFTDENHTITTNEIISELEKREIKAERKSIYADLALLSENGYEIEKIKEGGTVGYSLLDRKFELPELKLMVDAVQASKFISEKKSNNLIAKLEAFASKYQASAMQRQVYVTNRVKTDNESVYYNIDKINDAINDNKEISFKYYGWNIKKELELRPNGEKDSISPWALMWDDENYYMVAYDGQAKAIKHYRVDKMRSIIIRETDREGREAFDRFDMAIYAKKVFGMFTGVEQKLKLEFDNRLIGVVMDRFGKDVIVIPEGDDKFTVNVNVNVSNNFFGWLVGLGTGAKIIEPQSVVEQFKGELSKINEQYR